MVRALRRLNRALHSAAAVSLRSLPLLLVVLTCNGPSNGSGRLVSGSLGAFSDVRKRLVSFQ